MGVRPRPDGLFAPSSDEAPPAAPRTGTVNWASLRHPRCCSRRTMLSAAIRSAIVTHPWSAAASAASHRASSSGCSSSACLACSDMTRQKRLNCVHVSKTPAPCHRHAGILSVPQATPNIACAQRVALHQHTARAHRRRAPPPPPPPPRLPLLLRRLGAPCLAGVLPREPRSSCCTRRRVCASRPSSSLAEQSSVAGGGGEGVGLG